MEKLWAPWRMAYVEVSKPQGCIFCDKPREQRDDENLILQRGKTAFVMLNAFPYNNGHLMVAPYRHTAELESLSPEERDELMALAQESLRLLQAAFGPNGYNLGMNLGRVAGAGIADHLHLHVVPRWDGDTNFMPVVADTKVLPDSLQNSYRKLKEVLQRR
jgi:ATP adenylyltransferase